MTLGERLGRAAAGVIRPRPARQQAPSAVTQAFARSTRMLFSHFGRTLHRLGLQISAILYLVFTLGFASEALHRWRATTPMHRHLSLATAPAAVQIELALALLFAYFALSSLMRAHHS